jgi:hypothetical protein
MSASTSTTEHMAGAYQDEPVDTKITKSHEDMYQPPSVKRGASACQRESIASAPLRGFAEHPGVKLTASVSFLS